MPRHWSADQISAMARGYQESCVLVALAELELFDHFGSRQFTARQAAEKLGADLRAMTALLDAAAALELLSKSADHYVAAPGVSDALSSSGKSSVLAMTQHQANCLRSWAQLARVVKTGKPAERQPSIRGEKADHQAFIEAMDNVSAPVADKIIAELALPPFRHVLDVGGASGTWTIALLARNPQATATIFDLPAVIPQAQRRITQAGLSDRVDFVGGDFLVDALPAGTDLAWISAIIHQNSRQENRQLFASVFRAMNSGGHVLIRDVVMEDSRIAPVAGALFAINMLVNTRAGGTYTFSELQEDLLSAGFIDVKLLRRDLAMHSVLQARKPA